MVSCCLLYVNYCTKETIRLLLWIILLVRCTETAVKVCGNKNVTGYWTSPPHDECKKCKCFFLMNWDYHCHFVDPFKLFWFTTTMKPPSGVRRHCTLWRWKLEFVRTHVTPLFNEAERRNESFSGVFLCILKSHEACHVITVQMYFHSE